MRKEGTYKDRSYAFFSKNKFCKLVTCLRRLLMNWPLTSVRLSNMTAFYQQFRILQNDSTAEKSNHALLIRTGQNLMENISVHENTCVNMDMSLPN